MNLSDARFPRQLTADGSDEALRGLLTSRTVLLWPGGSIDVPVITLTEPLGKALTHAMAQGRLRFGFEKVLERLDEERAGIDNVREQTEGAYGERISRLILFSRDGAERFYRHVESLLRAHSPRLLGCLLEADGATLGRLVTGREKLVKIIMAEHKDAVSEILRSIAAGQENR
jgi:hypothetical protein